MDDWVTVHMGPVWQVELYSGLFDEQGIEAFSPDATSKVVDPFMTGGLPLLAQLQVRIRDVERAREILETITEEDDDLDLDALALATAPAPELGITQEEASGTDDETSIGHVRQRAETAIETLATRTRWAAVSVIAFPFAIIYGLRYAGVAKRRGIRSTKHRLTMAALCVGILHGLIVAAILITSALVGADDEPLLYW